jgi:Alginate export
VITARKILRCVAIVIACSARISHAQTAQTAQTSRLAYAPERYDEDWSFLRDPSKRTDFFDPIKWIPLDKNGSSYLTVGGELRENFQDMRNMEFGLPSPMHTANDFHRIFLFADVHLGQRFRTFVDLVNGEIIGAMAKPSPLQKDPLDILQAFADVIVPVRNHGAFTLRFGRHEMTFGSARLISFRDTPNVRLEFDGVRTFWTNGKGKRVDVLLVRPVKPRLGYFNDIGDSTQLLWGVYASSPISSRKGSLDLYYLGFDNKNASFAQGLGRERRHTIGARLFGERTGFDWHEAHDFRRGTGPDNDFGFDWDLEGAFQFGSFATTQIRAWMISTDWGYTVSAWRFSPRLGLKLDALSGDGSLQDNRLGTFNALYPALQYYSQPGLFAPSNLINFQPNITVDPTKGVSVNIAWSSLHRENKADAFYATPPLAPLPGTATDKRLIGEEASVNLAWQAGVHTTVLVTYAGFAPGGSVRQAGGRSGHWFLVLTQFKV